MIQTQLRVTSSFLVLQAQRGFWEGRPGGLGQWFSFCFALYDATTWYAGSKEEEADDPSFQGLWQHRPDNLNKTSSQPFSSGAVPQAQHAQQGGSNNLQQQGGSSRGYASEDSLATEDIVADALTAGNSTSTATSASPAQQDSLVSKVVGKLMPSALASKQAEEPEGPNGAEGHKGTYYGGVLDAAGNQTMNDSTDSEPTATKVPNWTNFLNDNGTTPVLSELDPIKPASSSLQNLGAAGALSELGSGAAEAQDTSSSSSTSATVGALAAEEGSSQHGTMALPADPTQSQANTMLSQAGLPANQPHSTTKQPQTDSGFASHVEQTLSQTDSTSSLGLISSAQLQSQTESSQSLGLLDKLAQGSLAQGGPGGAGLPEDWDWETYLQLNPDVAAAQMHDPASAAQHWQDWGRFENRQYKVSLGGRRALAGLATAFQQPVQVQDADSKAVDGVSDGVPSLWGRVPGSRKFRSKFGQQAITGVRQSKTAA
ncbi:hypothetical protein ABBQ38_015050 [Trebouxia sp. C0009 RCD-2024]